MKFLQTSDWHLGKSLCDQKLIEDQKAFLSQIIAELKRAEESGSPYTALLVPGDIYDRANPTAEIMDLFSDFLTELSNNFPKLHAFFLSGNHDDARLLYFGKSFFEKERIHICTDPQSYTTPYILQEGNEKAAVYQLPYLYPNYIKSVSSTPEKPIILHNQQEMYEEACRNLNAQIEQHEDMLNIFCGHLFTLNALKSETERSFLAEADQVSTALFSKFDYGAIGHIHKYQPCGSEKKLYYSGSPLAYAFDEKDSEKVMLSVELQKGSAPKVEKIPFKPLHQVVVLTDKSENFIDKNKNQKYLKEYKSSYVKFILTDDVLPENFKAYLNELYDYPLAYTMQKRELLGVSSTYQEKSRLIEGNSENKPEEIFNMFLEDIHSPTEDKELLEAEKNLFLEIAKEILK